MLKKFFLALALVMLVGSKAGAEDTELQRIADALDVLAIETFQLTGNDRMYAVGQSASPIAPWPRYYVKSLIRQYDFTVGAMREQELVWTQGEDPPGDRPDYSHEVDLTAAQHEIEKVAERDDLTTEDRQAILADNARRGFNLWC